MRATTTIGVAKVERFGVSGVGIGEFGVFGNPFVDPTKILFVVGNASGPQNNGLSGGAEVSWFQRF